MAASEDIYLRLMAPRVGTDFSPLAFLMTTSFGTYDFRPIEQAAAAGDDDETRRRFNEMLGAAPDRHAFLMEHILPLHEKRHFFDFVSTPYGIRLFLSGLLVTSTFRGVIHSLSQRGRKCRLPWRYWARHTRCPAAVRGFVRDYERLDSLLRSMRAGTPQSFPLDVWPGTNQVECIRMEVDGKYRPMVGYRSEKEIYLYPLNPISILEGLATGAQLWNLQVLDNQIAQQWLDGLKDLRSHWYYTAALRLALGCTKRDVDAALRALEFALLVPLPPSQDADENDPGARFYALVQYLLTHPGEAGDINAAAARTAEVHAWKSPWETLVEAERFLDQVQLPEDPTCQAVLDNYRALARKLLNARAGSPSMGVLYPLAMGREILPPVHRKLRPDGKLEMFTDPGAGEAWFTYLVLNSIMQDSVERSELHCPMALTVPGAVQPGDRSCSCEVQAQYDVCVVAEMVDHLGMQFE